MNTARFCHTATDLRYGKVLFAGGGVNGGGVSISSAELYDPAFFTITTSALSNGSITGIAVEGKYLTGTTATLTAVPAENYVFTGWTGAASGTDNPLSVLMDRDKTIGATFVVGVEVLAGGQVPTGSAVVWRGPLTLTMQTVFPNGAILYTLDGSAPSLGSTLYTGPLTLDHSCSVRAVAYSSDFSSQMQSPPLAVVIVPMLTTTTAGGAGLQVGTSLEGLVEDGFRLTLTGEFGKQYEILASADLVNWIQAGTLTNVYGTSQFTDGDATNQSRRFYRAAVLNQ